MATLVLKESFTPEEIETMKAMLNSQKEKAKEVKPKPVKVEGIQNAEYEIIVVGDGKNTHRVEKKPFSESAYERERFVIPRSLGDKVRSRIRFLVVFKDTNPPESVTLDKTVPINARLLCIADSSTTLKSALSDLFRKPFSFGLPSKKILFAGILIIVGVVVYLVYTGQLNLGKIIKI